MAFFQKEIYVKRKKREEYVYEKRGICLGVYLSKKTGTIKYLFCALDDDKTITVPVAAIEQIHPETGNVYLKNLRAAIPNQCARLTPFLPVYSCDGKYLGRLNDIFVQGVTATKLVVGEEKYPALSIDGVCDALLLKPLPYPLGEWSKEEETNVSRRLLKDKIKQGELIRFTLSLPPFTSEKEA